MRPFWIHQLVEYVIGFAVIAMGFQELEPAVPLTVGLIVLVNAAIVRGPLGAFRFVGRDLHRWLDVGVMIVVVVAIVQPWFEMGITGRLMLALVLVPYGFSWFYTDWAERRQRAERRRAATSKTSDDLGRRAGRLAGSAWLAGKRVVRDRQSDASD